MTLENYIQAQKTLSALIKAEKKIKELHSKQPNFMDVTRTRLAAFNDRLTGACFDRDKLIDDLHADLVDARLCPIKSDYSTRNLTHTHGLGHTYGFKYTPKIPKTFKGQGA